MFQIEVWNRKGNTHSSDFCTRLFILFLLLLSTQKSKAMAFNFTAFTYIIALIGDAFLIFFAIFHVIAFDELKTDYKNPIDQCNSLNPVCTSNERLAMIRYVNINLSLIIIIMYFQLVLPEYILHIFLNLLFLVCGEWFSLCINIPLIAYHIWR